FVGRDNAANRGMSQDGSGTVVRGAVLEEDTPRDSTWVRRQPAERRRGKGEHAMIQLRDDQLQALDTDKQPTVTVDPRTGQEYMLIKREVYNIVCGIIKPFNRGVEDDPEMD